DGERDAVHGANFLVLAAEQAPHRSQQAFLFLKDAIDLGQTVGRDDRHGSVCAASRREERSTNVYARGAEQHCRGSAYRIQTWLFVNAARSSALLQHIRLGDRAKVTCQQHLYRHDLLPVGVAQRDLGAVVLGLDVVGGEGEAAVEEVEDLGEAGGLR